jgi:hypothetical protein
MCALKQKDSIQKLAAKIYLFLATKIIYADSAEKEKLFYKHICSIPLCNFWYMS